MTNRGRRELFAASHGSLNKRMLRHFCGAPALFSVRFATAAVLCIVWRVACVHLPHCVGKSTLGTNLARRFNGEFWSVGQLFRAVAKEVGDRRPPPPPPHAASCDVCILRVILPLRERV